MPKQERKRNIQKTAIVFIVYENLRVGEGGMRRTFVEVFSTRKKASDYVKGTKYLIAECEVK